MENRNDPTINCILIITEVLMCSFKIITLILTNQIFNAYNKLYNVHFQCI